MTITHLSGRIITDSRGTPTLEVTVEAGSGRGTAQVPGGASTGTQEIATIPPNEALLLLSSKVAPAVEGLRVDDHHAIDTRLHELDAYNHGAQIGGNLMLAISLASVRAAALATHRELYAYIRDCAGTAAHTGRFPRLFVNLINGGKHADQGSPIQEHQIIPETDDVERAYHTACEVYKSLEARIHTQYSVERVRSGDEGGFSIPSTTVYEPLEHLTAAIASVHTPLPIAIGIDAAASSFFDASQGVYRIHDAVYTKEQFHAWYTDLLARFPSLTSIEDPFAEEDIASFATLHATHPKHLIIGDDLTTTNAQLLQRAVDARAINAIIIKPNQIGTFTDTLTTVALAHQYNIATIVSHRSGETFDDFIADLAWGVGAYGMKAGAPFSPERKAKYRRLITIARAERDAQPLVLQ